MARSQQKEAAVVDVSDVSPEQGTHTLRSVDEVDGYHIKARDGKVGHVEDFVMCDETWTIRYLVVDTRDWLPGRTVLLAPSWVDDVSWEDRNVAVGMTREVVKESPQYDPAVPISREYEKRLFDYYGKPGYWAD